jgi:hypothetical protein
MAENTDQEALERYIANLENLLKDAKSLLKSTNTPHNGKEVYNQITCNGTALQCGDLS